MLSANDQTSSGMDPSVVGHSRVPASKSAFANHMEATASQGLRPEQLQLQHIWIVTGPAGSGKTTVAKDLQESLGLPFLEGDDFHPPANKEKMSNGTPLTDADRWDWLISLRDAAIRVLSTIDPSSSQLPSGVIMSCSALKLKYRDVMRVAAYDHPSVRIHFIYLKADENTLLERVSERQSHYMKGGMVHSQFQTLEDPTDEGDVISIDVSTSIEDVRKKVLDAVVKELAEQR